MARGSAEYREIGAGRRRCAIARASIRRTPSAARPVRASSDGFDATDVLIDDRPVPYARELWLPLDLVPDPVIELMA